MLESLEKELTLEENKLNNETDNKEKKNFTASIAYSLWGNRLSQIFLKRMRITMTIWENYIIF